MHPGFQTILSIITLAVLAFAGEVSHNYKSIKHLARGVNHISQHLMARDLDPVLVAKARERFNLYNDLIDSSQLEQGMVVNRDWTGAPLHECDSLLFSSLRYASLKKMGLHQKASQAWQAIEQSQNRGEWFRHPNCHQSTSRDMLLGLLVALGQNPLDTETHLENLVAYVNKNDGFFSQGRFDRSYLSPGLAELIRLELKKNDIPKKLEIPLLPLSFSTIELSAMLPGKGYITHLTALSLWLEDDLASQGEELGTTLTPRSPINRLVRWGEPLMTAKLSVRRQWAAHQLYVSNPDNLFYRWLWLKSAGGLTPAVRNNLLEQLLAMPQFPENRLPQDCDRSADYLWQRSADEYFTSSHECSVTFNGIDFLWMTALILEDSPQFDRDLPEMVRVR